MTAASGAGFVDRAPMSQKECFANLCAACGFNAQNATFSFGLLKSRKAKCVRSVRTTISTILSTKPAGPLPAPSPSRERSACFTMFNPQLLFAMFPGCRMQVRGEFDNVDGIYRRISDPGLSGMRVAVYGQLEIMQTNDYWRFYVASLSYGYAGTFR